jgi:hypothetical protein
METEQLRQALVKLNNLHYTANLTEQLRKGVGEEASERTLIHAMDTINPDHVTWDEIRREIAAIEQQFPAFAILYWKERRTYVLLPRVVTTPHLTT